MAETYAEIGETSENTREGKVSPLGVVDECLGRIEALDPKLNAFITVKDFAAPSPRQVERGVGSILETVAGEAAAVHCGGGLGRTGTLLACYLASSEGIGAEEAIGRVRALRAGSVETRPNSRRYGRGPSVAAPSPPSTVVGRISSIRTHSSVGSAPPARSALHLPHTPRLC